MPWIVERFNQRRFSDAGILAYDEIAERIYGPGEDEASKKARRGVVNNVFLMAFARLPITGDLAQTAASRIQHHRTCMIQGDMMIKLQRFDIPSGARQLRALSRNTVDNGPGFEATVWTYVSNGDGFTELKRLYDHWRIPEGSDGETCYVIGLYKKDGLFFSSQTHYSGADIDDIAGTIEQVRFTFGGKIRDVQIKEVFRFPPSVPLQFFKYPPQEVASLKDPKLACKDDFSALMEHFEATVDGENARSVVESWNSTFGEDTDWVGFELEEVSNDFLFWAVGSRGESD